MSNPSIPPTITPQQVFDEAKRLAQNNQLQAALRALSLGKRLRIGQRIAQGHRPWIRIFATSDNEKDEFRRMLWGDYWVQHELTRRLGEAGYPITRSPEADVVIHLYGFPTALPRHAYSVVWIYSHPDTVTPDMLQIYDYIYTLSEDHRRHLSTMGQTAEVLLGATDKRPYPCRQLEYPAVFVGNTRRGGTESREVVDALAKTDRAFLVWGNAWENFVPPERIGGLYYSYNDLQRLYATSEYVLSDHHADMRRFGFVAVKIFDVLASGGFAISDRNPGIEPIFGDTVPQFSTADELRAILERYAPGTSERETLRKRGQEIALQHTWKHRAQTFIGHLEKAFEVEGVFEEIRTSLPKLVAS